MSKLTTKKLDFWVNNNLNVLFIGSHGIGKTAIIEETFNRHNLNWKYYSAATMDPWVDLIGVPKAVTDDQGNTYLDLIRPSEFQNDQVEAIFFDEFNRAQAKTRNAVMELIQFKSINGRKFHNLKIVWAAINPYDEEETYDVDQLDPAQQDRFHIIYTLPEVPDKPFFIDKFGPTLGDRAVEWWKMLPQSSQKLVSPRRLDYAVDIHTKGGDLMDVLPKECRPKTLKMYLERIGDTTASHTDRWLHDPDMYIMEIANRVSKINVVDAFEELQNISVDQAVSYIHKLPSPALKQLASSSRTIYMLVYSLFNGDNTRKIETALASNRFSENDIQNMLGELMVKCKEESPPLFKALSVVSGNRSTTDAWTQLKAVVFQMIKKETLTHELRQLITICCVERIGPHTSIDMGNSIVSAVVNIVVSVIGDEEKTTRDLVNIVKIAPEKIIAMYKAL